ncbi:MAG: hypothetical protein PUJ57_03035 [Peptoniphilaceae bacterium]|nr:hypothetical protein [Peptoniphilaceae bacterium]MDY6085417.1 hypothetical protein [Peptoniphilaceae bacterium]
MKTQTRRITSLLLAGALMAMQPQVTWARQANAETETQASQEETKTAVADFPEKSETVYALLDAAGQSKSLYVVNRFAPTSQPLTDRGNYTQTEMLSTSGEVKSETAGQFAIKTGDEPLYYQGTLAEKALPWEVELAYTLDGSPVDGAELAGKSGHLELSLTVRPRNDAAAKAYTEAMMLQASVTLPGDVAHTVETETGSVAAVGSSQRVDFVILPKSDVVTHTLSADVQDFHLPSITIAAVRMTTDLSAIDWPDFADDPDLRELQDGTGALRDATRRLADGLGQADDGYRELSLGMGRLGDGLTTLRQNGATLADGVSRYVGGVNELSAASAPLREGASASFDGAQSLNEAMTRVNDGWSAYANGVNQYVQGVNQGLSGVGQLADSADALIAGADALRDGLRGVAQSGSGLVKGSEEIQQGIALLRQALKPEANPKPSGTGSAATPHSAGAASSATSHSESTASSTLPHSESTTSSTPPHSENTPSTGSAFDTTSSINPTTVSVSSSLPSREALLAKKEALKTQGAAVEKLKTAVDGLSEALGEQIEALEGRASLDASAIASAAGISAEGLENEDVQQILAYVSETHQAETAAQLKKLHALYDGPGAPVASLKAGVDQLVSAWETTSAEMSTSLDQLLALRETLGALGASSASNPAAQQLVDGVVKLDEQYVSFHKGLDQYVEGVKALSARFGGTEVVGADVGDATTPAPEAAVPDEPNFYDGFVQWASGVKQVAAGASELSSGSNALTDSATTASLLKGQEAIGQGVFALTGGLSRMSEGMKAYLDGVSLLGTSGDALVSGLGQYTDGVAQVADGVSTWQDGFAAFGQGLGSAADGAAELADGTQALADGTSSIEERIDEKIQEIVDDMNPSEAKLPSFADVQNGTVDRVQFVFMTEAIQVPEEESPAPEESTEEPSFWERLGNLFH